MAMNSSLPDSIAALTDLPQPEEFPDHVEIPIDGTLDLHQFRPSDIGSLVPEYLATCRDHGLLTVRVVHGKGTGTQREQVHRILDQTAFVSNYTLAGPDSGGWGATWVYLAGKEDQASQAAAP